MKRFYNLTRAVLNQQSTSTHQAESWASLTCKLDPSGSHVDQSTHKSFPPDPAKLQHPTPHVTRHTCHISQLPPHFASNGHRTSPNPDHPWDWNRCLHWGHFHRLSWGLHGGLTIPVPCGPIWVTSSSVRRFIGLWGTKAPQTLPCRAGHRWRCSCAQRRLPHLVGPPATAPVTKGEVRDPCAVWFSYGICFVFWLWGSNIWDVGERKQEMNRGVNIGGFWWG